MANQTDKATIDLVINGQQSETTLKQIATAAVNARKALNQMAETDPGYARQKAQLEALMRAQQQRVVRINEEKTAWEKFKAGGAGQITAGIVGANLVQSGLAAIRDGIRKSIDDFKAFDAASKDLSAVTGATGADLEYLNQQAKKTGPAMGKTGAEMLEAYKLMASAKPELLDQKELLVETTQAALTLAQAGKIDLAEATKVTAESLNQFGQGADQAGRFINVIAAGAKEGSAEINEMSGALKASGTVAAAQGVSFEYTNATLQSLSTIALKGEQAGTGLRNVLLTLGSGADETNPKIVGMGTALDNLAKKNLSTAEMTKLFGKENVVAAQHIITHREQIQELTDKITGTNEAYTQAAKNNASYEHQVALFEATMSKLAVTIGTKVIPVVTGFMNGIVSVANWFDQKLTPASESATAAFEDQRGKVQSLTKNIEPLLARHDELKKKTVLTKDEQNELKKIVNQVAGAVPQAATEFDKYGNALSVNTEKAREFIRIQKEMLKYNNKTAIDKTDEELTGKLAQQKTLLARLNSGVTTERVTVDRAVVDVTRKLTAREIQQMQGELAAINDDLKGLEARKKGLTGSYLDEPKTPKPATPNDAASNGTGVASGTESKQEKAARLKREREAKAAEKKRERETAAAAKHEESLEDLMSQARQRTAKNDGDSYEKAVLALEQHYKKMETLAKGNTDKLNQIEELKDQEMASLQQKETERQAKAAEKQAADAQKQRDDEYQTALAALQLQYETEQQQQALRLAGHPEADPRGLELQMEEQFLQAKLLLEQTYGQKTVDAQQGITDNTIKQAQRRTAGEREQTQQRKQLAALETQYRNELFGTSVSALKGFFKQSSGIQRAMLIAEKAWAIAQIGIGLAKQIQKINEVAIMIDAVTLGTGGSVYQVPQIIKASALAAAQVAGIASTSFSTPGFLEGGYHRNSTTAPAGYVSTPTYYSSRNFTAAEDGKQEYIISNPMLQNPVVANLTAALDAMRVTGSYRDLSYSSGTVQQAGAASDKGQNDLLLMTLIGEVRNMHKTLESQGGDQTVQNLFELERTQNRIKEIRQVTSL